MKNEEEKGEDAWSEWLDFDQSNITKLLFLTSQASLRYMQA